ncbi:hypothetical protein Q3G72_015887 [Acer saccharum]|nr:hypothetical protein Q3G72_015887 [Acer saccharum]
MVDCRRCSEMEAEIAKKKSEHEALEVRFRALEVEKVGIEDELKAFKREKEEGIVDLTTEDADKEEEEEEEETDLESKFEETPDYHTPSKHISCSKGENGDGNGELKIDHGR